MVAGAGKSNEVQVCLARMGPVKPKLGREKEPVSKEDIKSPPERTRDTMEEDT